MAGPFTLNTIGALSNQLVLVVTTVTSIDVFSPMASFTYVTPVYKDLLTGGAGASPRPTIGSFSPSTGSAITPTTSISFVINASVSIAQTIVIARYPNRNRTEEVWNGSAFNSKFSASSTHSGGVGLLVENFTIVRNEGWPDDVTLEIYNSDAVGNTPVASSFNWLLTGYPHAPTVSSVTPANGAFLNLDTGNVAFDLTDVIPMINQVIVANLGGTRELVWDSNDNLNFTSKYSTSTRNAITNGFHFVIARTGGWNGVIPTLHIEVTDNLGDQSALGNQTWVQTGASTILMARSIDEFTVDVLFDNLQPAPLASGALVPSNWIINNGLSCTSVKQVTVYNYRLTTTKQAIGTTYTVTTQNM